MKLNIVMPNVPAGNAPDYETFEVTNLNKLPDASCTGLYTSSLDSMPDRYAVLTEMIKKLRYGASLVIEGVDVLDVARNLHIGALPIEEANTLLYNKGTSVSCDTIFNLIDFCQSLGLNIKHKRIINNRYSIEAVRPNAN